MEDALLEIDADGEHIEEEKSWPQHGWGASQKQHTDGLARRYIVSFLQYTRTVSFFHGVVVPN